MKLGPIGKSTKVADNLVWTAQHDFYSIERKGEGGVFWCRKVNKTEIRTDYIPDQLPWGSVGAYKYLGEDQGELLPINRNQILGKAMVCGTVMTTWKREWLMSKEDV